MSTNSEGQTSKRLTLDDRIEILKRLETGESCTNLADAYGITKSAITWIKKNKENILHQKRTIDEAGGCSNKRKRSSGVEETQLDKLLHQWFVEQSSKVGTVSRALMKEQALLINQQINGSSSFKASDGFLHKFKKRHGIENWTAKEPRPVSEKEASETFSEEFSEFITENGYGLDTVYSVAETGLYWKMIPNKTLTSSKETTFGSKLLNDHVMIMVCSNASGTHKLPLMVLGKSPRPKCFKNVEFLPVEYKWQKSTWVNCDHTTQWYSEIFLPEIKRFHGPNAKCILLLDNTRNHPPEKQLNALSDLCIIKYLPANVTDVIQPMYQGIIDQLKKNYRKNLLRLVLTENTVESVHQLLIGLNMLHCCNFVATAWKDVTQANVRNGWRMLFPAGCDIEFVDYDLQPETFFQLASRIPGHEEITIEDTDHWLQIDNDCRLKIPLDEAFSSGTYLDESEEYDPHNDDDEAVVSKPTAKDALKSIDTFTQWYQSRCDYESEVLEVLESLRAFTIDQIVTKKMDQS